jgi:hypothetical protein
VCLLQYVDSQKLRDILFCVKFLDYVTSEKKIYHYVEVFLVVSIQRANKLIERGGKQREVCELFVPEASGFDETPDTFDEIKVGGIGWKVKELHVERVCHFHNQWASLVTGIVHPQRNLLSGIRGTDFLQKFADYFRINRSGCPNAHEIMVACLNGAENAVTLPPTSTWHKDPGEGPNHAQKGIPDETSDNLSQYHRRGSALGQSTGEERSDRVIAPSSIGYAGGAVSRDHQVLPQSLRDPRHSVLVLSRKLDAYPMLSRYSQKSENILQMST